MEEGRLSYCQISLITARNVVREGNVFMRVCQSVCPTLCRGGPMRILPMMHWGVLKWYIKALWDRSHATPSQKWWQKRTPRSGGGRGPPRSGGRRGPPEVVAEEEPTLEVVLEEDHPPRQGPDQTS